MKYPNYNARIFSQRSSFPRQQNRLAKLLSAKQERRETILDLTISNPTQVGISYPEKDILQAISSPSCLVYEPSPYGLASARETVSAYYARRGRAIPPNQILLTSSTSEAYTLLFKLLTDPGDQVLVPCPSYPLLEYLTVSESITPIPYPLIYDEIWQIDLAQLEHSISNRTRALLLLHPNNPTGSYIKRKEWEVLKELSFCHSLPLICDEVFFQYFMETVEEKNELNGEELPLMFLLNGLSKTVGLPQLKLAWIAAVGPRKECSTSLKNLEILSDTYLSLATPVQHGLQHLLDTDIQHQIHQRCRKNLHTLGVILKESPVSPLRTEGGWYAILKLPQTLSDEEWSLELLRLYGVLTSPGFLYEFPQESHLVLSLITEENTFKEGVRRLVNGVQKLI